MKKIQARTLKTRDQRRQKQQRNKEEEICKQIEAHKLECEFATIKVEREKMAMEDIKQVTEMDTDTSLDVIIHAEIIVISSSK